MFVEKSQVLNSCLFFLIIFIANCSNPNKKLVENVLENSGDNRRQIEQFLENYSGDKLFAAEYLVGGMPGLATRTGSGMDSLESLYATLPVFGSYYLNQPEASMAKVYADMPLSTIPDAENISSVYLRNNLDEAWETWQNSPWKDKISLDMFCELILPYRLGDEPLTEWRKPYRDHLKIMADSISKTPNTVDAARIVSDFIGTAPYNDQVSTPHRSALALLNHPLGACRDDCDRTIYAMRAFGIPTAIDMMVISPDHIIPHVWNVVYDTDDKIFRMFDNDTFRPTRDSLHYDKRRKGKVYRKTYELNAKQVEKFRNTKNPPSYLVNPRLKDVTDEYFGENEAILYLNTKEDIYLGVFGNGSYHPIDIGIKNGNKTIFRNIEPNVIFFPLVQTGSNYKPVGLPFLLQPDGSLHIFKPTDKLQKVSLERKYPRGIHTDWRLESVKGLQVRWASSPNGQWTTIGEITEKPEISFVPLILPEKIKGGYINLFNPKETPANMADIFLCHDDKAIQKTELSLYRPDVIVDEETADRLDKYSLLVDGDLLTPWLLEPGRSDLTIKVADNPGAQYLFIVPHNDDNFVLPGQEYELLYFCDDGWKSLGRKIADDFHIDFLAPENSLLLLKNHTKGKEEQVFIYENGRQFFNSDLSPFK